MLENKYRLCIVSNFLRIRSILKDLLDSYGRLYSYRSNLQKYGLLWLLCKHVNEILNINDHEQICYSFFSV